MLERELVHERNDLAVGRQLRTTPPNQEGDVERGPLDVVFVDCNYFELIAEEPIRQRRGWAFEFHT